MRRLLILTFAVLSSAVTVDLSIINLCTETIWPALATTGGAGPSVNGFELASSNFRNLTVDTNWNGRVWGRTNCTFNANGIGRCLTGDCGGVLNCKGVGAASTLAEFNLPGGLGQSYYDISLVDGYNLPIAIEAIQANGVSSPPTANVTNPSCVGDTSRLTELPFTPYNNSQTFLGTSGKDPLPFESSLTFSQVSGWCPSDLLLQDARGNGKIFNPCVSPCERYKVGIYCCTGKYDSAKKCRPNYYATEAKKVCPDAYSYAFDDASSTFTSPTGTSFRVTFCPGGRSTKIKKTLAPNAAVGTSPSGTLVALGFVLASFMIWL